jgi:hypothetical protein
MADSLTPDEAISGEGYICGTAKIVGGRGRESTAFFSVKEQ